MRNRNEKPQLPLALNSDVSGCTCHQCGENADWQECYECFGQHEDCNVCNGKGGWEVCLGGCEPKVEY